MSDIPPTFKPLAGFRTSPFLETNGPFYYREDGKKIILAVKIEEKHTNARGFAHGGLLVTLADVALGYNAVQSQDTPLSFITTNLSVDFANSAKLGDWVEAHVDIQKVGGRIAFANAYLTVGEERIVRASGVFAVVKKSD
jgi:acyl-coenzyme A thioesterase 13